MAQELGLMAGYIPTSITTSGCVKTGNNTNRQMKNLYHGVGWCVGQLVRVGFKLVGFIGPLVGLIGSLVG
jgi:hypothetical protein